MAKCNPKNHVNASREQCDHAPVRHRPGLAGTPTGYKADKCRCCDCRLWNANAKRKERGTPEPTAPVPARPARAAKTAGEPRRRVSKPTVTPTAPAVADPRKLARADLAKILAALAADPDWWSAVTEDVPGELEALAALIESHNAKGKTPRLRFENDDSVGWFVAPDTEPEPEPEPAPEQPAGESYLSAFSRALNPFARLSPLAGPVTPPTALTRPGSTIPAKPRPTNPPRYDGPAKPRSVPMGIAPSLPGSGVRQSDTRLPEPRYATRKNTYGMCEIEIVLPTGKSYCNSHASDAHRLDQRPICRVHYDLLCQTDAWFRIQYWQSDKWNSPSSKKG